jgi:hypothetical protein
LHSSSYHLFCNVSMLPSFSVSCCLVHHVYFLYFYSQLKFHANILISNYLHLDAYIVDIAHTMYLYSLRMTP